MPQNKFQDTDAYNVHTLLTSIDKIVVPHFQRDYSWNTDKGDKGNQVFDLWQDICAKYHEYLQSNKNQDLEYLLGPMIFIDGKNDVHEIVDGQQRLSTLTMILCIARDILHEFCMDDPDNAAIKPNEAHYELIENLNSSICNDDQKLSEIKLEHENWKLVMNKNDKEFFEKLVQQYVLDKDDPFVRKGSKDLFRRISKKIEHWNDPDKQQNLSESNIKIYNAYNFLYVKMKEALLLDFKFEIEYDIKYEEIKNQHRENEVKKVADSPDEYGFTPKFFDDTIMGYDVLKSGNWEDDDKSLVDIQFDKYNKRRTTKISFDDWIQKKLSDKCNEKQSNSICLQEIMDDNDGLDKFLNEKMKKNTSSLKKFITKIFTHFFNIRIVVDNDDDAFQIFETVNARGATLSKTNLIKNYILRNIDTKIEDTYAQKWDTLLKDIDDKDKDNFFMDSVRSRGQKFGDAVDFSKYKINGIQGKVKLNNDNIYKIIKTPFLNLVDKHSEDRVMLEKEQNLLAKDFIEKQLQNDLEIYRFLKEPKEDEEKNQEPSPKNIFQCLKDLNDLNATYVHIILMTASRKWTKSSDEFIILTKLLTMFFIRCKTLGGGSASTIEKIMFKSCGQIENTANSKIALTNIIKIISYYDDEDEFKNYLTMTRITATSTAKFILQHIVDYLEIKYSCPRIPKMELEHILPKNPKSDDSKSSWDKNTFFSTYDDKVHHYAAKNFQAWHERLGNLTLLTKTVNIDARNYNFPTKLAGINEFKGYKNSKLFLNEFTLKNKPKKINFNDWTKAITESELKSRSDWTVNDIHERTQWLYQISSLIWKLPSVMCTNPNCTNHKVPVHAPVKLIDKIDTWKCEICENTFSIEWNENVDRSYKIPKDYDFSCS